jgi:hypothetical protein
MSSWQPIDTAPKDGTPVLVCNGERGGAWVAYYDPVFPSGYRPENPWSSLMLNMRWHATKWASTVPTHWMPIPAPYSAVETGRGLDMSDQPMGDPHPADLSRAGVCAYCGGLGRMATPDHMGRACPVCSAANR